tara:strand:- start:157 stop:567 length:411 start_codon:yes stop_codon:yes gene_type:complete
MTIQKTLSIIKPDATKLGYTDLINQMIEDAGLKIIEKKQLTLNNDQAKEFYKVHSDKSFYNELCDFMTSGPIVVQILEGDNAIELYRQTMGATNPEEADANTIRKKFASSIQENAVHGSDSEENAVKEIEFFFKNS